MPTNSSVTTTTIAAVTPVVIAGTVTGGDTEGISTSKENMME